MVVHLIVYNNGLTIKHCCVCGAPSSSRFSFSPCTCADNRRFLVKHSALRQQHSKAWNLQISPHVPSVFVTHKSVGLNWGLCTHGALSFCGYNGTLKTRFAQDCMSQWHSSNKISLNTLPVCKLFRTLQRTAVGLSRPYCKHVYYWCNKSTHTGPHWHSLITIYTAF